MSAEDSERGSRRDGQTIRDMQPHAYGCSRQGLTRFAPSHYPGPDRPSGSPLLDCFLAERGGFEPPVRLPAHALSKRAPSATRTSLHKAPEGLRREPRIGGEGGIRTPGRVAPTLVFETSPFSRSGTSPLTGAHDAAEDSGPAPLGCKESIAKGRGPRQPRATATPAARSASPRLNGAGSMAPAQRRRLNGLAQRHLAQLTRLSAARGRRRA